MKFGISQLKNESPKWVKLLFGIIILLTTATTFLIASEPRIPNELKVEIGVYIKTFEIIFFGISKMFGINSQDEITELIDNKDK